MKPDAEAFDSAMTTLSAKLDVYEKILSKQKYLAGDVRPLPLILKASTNR